MKVNSTAFHYGNILVSTKVASNKLLYECVIGRRCNLCWDNAAVGVQIPSILLQKYYDELEVDEVVTTTFLHEKNSAAATLSA